MCGATKIGAMSAITVHVESELVKVRPVSEDCSKGFGIKWNLYPASHGETRGPYVNSGNLSVRIYSVEIKHVFVSINYTYLALPNNLRNQEEITILVYTKPVNSQQQKRNVLSPKLG